jgi:SAM-dependent methyltransferase
MTLDDFAFLLTTSGERWLAELAATPITKHNHLQIVMRLRRDLSAAQAQAVMETAVLRQKAVTKFSRAAQMYFTRPALEQSSSEIIAAYRARRFADAGVRRVADLGCGIGGDAIGLAAHAHVIGVDMDPLRLAMAEQNLSVYGRRENFQSLHADFTTLSPLDVDGLFFDPARRDERGKRFFSVEAYRPPLSWIDGWRNMVEKTAVKISPGVDYDELPADAEVEFISVRGELKEAVLWYGALRTPVERRATLLVDDTMHTMTTTDMPDNIDTAPPKRFLYEPDNAIIRAHLVQQLAAHLGATKLDDDIAYLSSDAEIETPFARRFPIDDCFPFQLKRLRHYLRERDIGQVTIKKRGSPLEPEQLRQVLRLRGKRECTIFLTFVEGETAVLVSL